MVIQRMCSKCKKTTPLEIPETKSRKEVERFCKNCGTVMRLTVVPKKNAEYNHMFRGKELDVVLAYGEYKVKLAKEKLGEDIQLSPAESIRLMIKDAEKVLVGVGEI